MIRLEVRQGDGTPRFIVRDDGAAEPFRIGRGADNELVLHHPQVSSTHARVLWSGEHFVLQDQQSTNGTVVRRGTERLRLDDVHGRQAVLCDGDLVELGPPDAPVVLSVLLRDDVENTQLVTSRSIDELPSVVGEMEKRPSLLRQVHEAAQRIGATVGLEETLRCVGDAVLALLPKATHVTVALREDEPSEQTRAPAYVPLLTRVRGEERPASIPLTRSIFRKVVQERAAVLAADAPAEVGTASLLGANIRSTLGVPLWKGAEILGVLQVDNRASAQHGSAGFFDAADLDLLSVLAASVSLAIANARLIERLHFAEEQLRRENSYLKNKEEKREGRRPIVGTSRAMEELRSKIGKVVNTRVTVLIEGETGVGKELIASAIHYQSNRRDKLFVAQNCAALPESLLESELFGHKKGSFTGATDDKRGLFELADGGTLFLDEVTEMPISLQSKLLRALQEGEIRPLGATKPLHVNVRIVAATNRDLRREVEEKRFREDLYYRLAVFPVRVPPLRERREDVAQLANHFLSKYATEMGKHVAGVAQQALELLMGYDWPGNVRELENEVQRLVIQIEPGDFVTPDLLSPRIRQVNGIVDKASPRKGTLKEMMDQVEKYVLIESLREHGNNKTAAARSLGITREGLHKKLRSFGIS